jgi:serine/threonine protein kinase
MFSIGCILYELITGRKLFRDSPIPRFFEATHLPVIDLNEPNKQYEPLLRSMVSFDPTSLPILPVINDLLRQAYEKGDSATSARLSPLIAASAKKLKTFGRERPKAGTALQMWNELHPREAVVVEQPRPEGGLPAASIESRAVVGEIIAAVNATNATKEAKGGRQTRKRKDRLSKKRRR